LEDKDLERFGMKWCPGKQKIGGYCKNSYFGLKTIQDGKQRLFGFRRRCHPDFRDSALGF
jgi:hypothetical protein